MATEKSEGDFFLETGKRMAALEQEADALRLRCAELEKELLEAVALIAQLGAERDKALAGYGAELTYLRERESAMRLTGELQDRLGRALLAIGGGKRTVGSLTLDDARTVLLKLGFVES